MVRFIEAHATPRRVPRPALSPAAVAGKIIRDVFGTVRDDDPTMRQVHHGLHRNSQEKDREVELGAAIALNMLINDDEWKAEVYSCASTASEPPSCLTWRWTLVR